MKENFCGYSLQNSRARRNSSLNRLYIILEPPVLWPIQLGSTANHLGEVAGDALVAGETLAPELGAVELPGEV